MEEGPMDLATRGWGLDVKAAAPLSGGLVNRVWRVETKDGLAWFLKQYAPDLAGDAERTLAVQEWARQQGLPVPKVLPTCDGRLAYQRNAGEAAGGYPTAAVSQFMPGRALSPREMEPVRLAAMGRTLARLHGALAQWPDTAPSRPPSGPEALAAHLDELEVLVRGRPFEPEVDDLALSCLATKRKAMQRWDLGPHLYEGAAWQMLHRDFRLDNLLFSPAGEVTAVLDFDFAREGYVAWEVMRAAMTASWREAGGMDLDQAGHVVGAYLHSLRRDAEPGRRLDLKQVRLFARLWLDNLVRTTWPLDVPYHKPQAYHPGLVVILRDRDRQTRWLTQHLPEVEERLVVSWDSGRQF